MSNITFFASLSKKSLNVDGEKEADDLTVHECAAAYNKTAAATATTAFHETVVIQVELKTQDPYIWIEMEVEE